MTCDGKFYLTIRVHTSEHSEVLTDVFNEYMGGSGSRAVKNITHEVGYSLTLEELGMVQDALRRINKQRQKLLKSKQKMNK